MQIFNQIHTLKKVRLYQRGQHEPAGRRVWAGSTGGQHGRQGMSITCAGGQHGRRNFTQSFVPHASQPKTGTHSWKEWALTFQDYQWQQSPIQPICRESRGSTIPNHLWTPSSPHITHRNLSASLPKDHWRCSGPATLPCHVDINTCMTYSERGS